MRKLKLDVDTLQVDSFVADPVSTQRGTVNGQVGDTPIPNTAPPGNDSTNCDPGTGGWGSLFGTCQDCPTQGTCVGPTYCCPPTWRQTCEQTCQGSCEYWDCGS